MSDVAAGAVAQKSPKKKTTKPKKASVHPKYSLMISQAIASLKERGGSSRQAILKYIIGNFNLGSEEKTINSHLKLALRAGVEKNVFVQAKGTGASGSFKLNKVKVEKKPAVKKPAMAKKPKANLLMGFQLSLL